MLARFGVDRGRMHFVDRPALGEGPTSAQAIQILKQHTPDFSEDTGQPVINNIVPENGQ